MNRTIASINLKTYSSNIQRLLSDTISPHTKLMAIVKANGYGHGIIKMAQTAITAGATYLGVANLNEAILLRNNDINGPILLLSEPKDIYISEILNFNITQTIYTLSFAQALNKAAANSNKKIKIHIKIDTGMNRLGHPIKKAVPFIKDILGLSNLIIEGIFTHFSNANDFKTNFTLYQLDMFKKLLKTIENQNISIPLKHAANSLATTKHPSTHLDMVRIGLFSYSDVLSISSYLGYIKHVKKGSPIGYGGTYITPKDTNIGIVYAGYGDGIPVALSNKGNVLINGIFYPIIGQVCMDMLTVDLGSNNILPNLNSEVIILGKQNNSQISISDICNITKQIPYDFLCSITQRAKRTYINI
jgi:alanine racemase